jgi:NAD(P)-dependent dehydrogenase (short-subunit alcohol dehydrogenase family)
MVGKVVAAYGQLDCAVNNAGVSGAYVGVAGQKTAEWSEEAFNQVIAVNLTGVWLCMKQELAQRTTWMAATRLRRAEKSPLTQPFPERERAG